MSDPIVWRVLEGVGGLLLTGADVEDVLRTLAETDWRPLLEERMEQLRIQRETIHEAHLAVEVPCENCGARLPRRHMTYYNDVPTRQHKPYCPECAPEIRHQFERRCSTCGEMFIDPYTPNPQCGPCRAKNSLLESTRLANQSARTYGYRATLTIDEWMRTLEHFGGLCAYCRKWPFSEMDHLVPLGHGGWTTADNCVPACKGCNSSKRDRVMPESWAPEVRAYFSAL